MSRKILKKNLIKKIIELTNKNEQLHIINLQQQFTLQNCAHTNT